MDLQTSKTALIEWLSALEDDAILQKILMLMEDSKVSASEAEKASVAAGLTDAEKGNLAPQTAAEKIYGKWL